MDSFRPIPVALTDRIHRHAAALEVAKTTPDQLRALFLCHCELKDAAELLAPDDEAAQVAIRNNQEKP